MKILKFIPILFVTFSLIALQDDNVLAKEKSEKLTSVEHMSLETANLGVVEDVQQGSTADFQNFLKENSADTVETLSITFELTKEDSVKDTWRKLFELFVDSSVKIISSDEDDLKQFEDIETVLKNFMSFVKENHSDLHGGIVLNAIPEKKYFEDLKN